MPITPKPRETLWACSILASFLPLAIGCKTLGSHSTKEPIVFMDQWWNVDYAKNRCEQREHLNVPQCDGDPTSEVKDYQRQIATAFAANPTCHGFRMIGAIE